MNSQKRRARAAVPSRRGLLGWAIAGLFASAIGTRLAGAHPYHGVQFIDVQVLGTKRAGRRLKAALRLKAPDSGDVEVADAYVLGAIVRRRALPVRLAAGMTQDLEIAVDFPGPVPDHVQLQLLIVPPRLLQAVDLRVSG